MRYLGMFFRRITDDFGQKELLPLKLLFFVHASTLYVLYPYLTIHMRELGINVEEAAIMSAVTPIVAIIMPPLAGMIADRIGNFKFILAVFNGLGGASSLLLLLVPVGRITFTYPERTILSLGCPNNNSDGLLNINLAEQHECNTLSSIADTQFGNKSMIINAQLEACGLICTRHPNDFIPQGIKGPKTLEDESKAILSTRNYTVILKNILRNTSDQYTYTLKADDLPLYKAPRPEDEDKRNLRQMVNKQHYPTSVRKLTDMTYFFPTSGLYNFSCAPENEKNITESYLCNIEKINGVFPSVVASKAQSLDMKIKAAQSKNAENINKLYITDINVLHGNKYEFMDTICGLEEEIITQSVIVPLPNPENTLETDALLNLVDCRASCLMTLPRNKLCSNMDHTVEYDIRLTFWIYLVIRVFIGMISGTAFAMFEGAVIAILRNHKGDYGLQRIYAAIGGMISSPLSGILIDYASTGKGYTDFRPAFYLYAGLKIVSGVLMLSINLQFKSPATNIVKDVMSVLRNIEIVALFITCFILGTAWGYIESFLFWLLQDLGASRSLMGITITIGGIAGLPLLVLSGPIIDRIGHANVLFIGFIFYAIRLMGYSLIYNPWMCLIFEAMESVTSSLAITAAVTYAAKLSTNTTDSSIQGLLGGLYFGVGKGAGSLVGGYLMKAVGTRPTYQIFSVVMLITGCLYYIFNHFYIVRRAHLLHKHDPDKKATNFGAWENKNAIEKKREAELSKKNQNNVNNTNESNHVIENVPLKVSAPNVKNYTNDINNIGNENHNDLSTEKKIDSGGSEKVNPAFEEDEDESKVRSRSNKQADDSRNKEER